MDENNTNNTNYNTTTTRSTSDANKRMWGWVGAIVVILVIVIGYVAYQSHKQAEINNAGASSTVNTPTPTASTTPAAILNVKHQYVGGTHTYAGNMDLPNPCTTLALQAVQDPANPNHYTLEFTTSESSANTQVCAQVITSVPFKTSFAAAQNANVDATLNGAPLTLDVFEVPAGENLDNYNIDIKG